MALIDTGSDYTRTGDNFLTRWGNKLSFLPNILGGGVLGATLNFAGALVESMGLLFKGKLGSAVTALTAGTVSAVLNGAGSLNPISDIRWFVNIGSGVTTGKSLGTHGRALTESVIGGVTGIFGMKPEILVSHTVGVVGINGGTSIGPGYYATRAAQERGQDPNRMWTNYRNGAGAEHVSALESARANGPSYRQV